MSRSDHQQRSQKSQGKETYLIADDDEFFRVALRSVLARNFEGAHVIETSSFDEAVEQMSEGSPVSLALFDLSMPGMESAASIRAVREEYPVTKIAVVSASKRRSDILLALEAGAHGYVPKGLGVAELSRAVQMIRSGILYVPPSIADLTEAGDQPSQLPTRGVALQATEPGVGLTPRQTDVLRLLVEGLNNKAIARELNLGEGTVKVHMAALFRVLRVNSRSAAAAVGARMFGVK